MLMTPSQRLARMRHTFNKDRSVLKEDYDYFITPDVPTPRSKADRKSGVRRARQVPKRS